MHYPCMFIAVYVRNTCTYNVLNISSDSCVCSPCFCRIIYQSWQFMSTIYLPFRIISIISCFPLVCAILSSIYLLSSSSFNFSETAISLILHHNFTIEILLLKINLLPNLIFENIIPSGTTTHFSSTSSFLWTIAIILPVNLPTGSFTPNI